MYEEDFSRRLSYLRTKQGISARDMSLSLGQNPGYINTIENRKAFPTMSNFFYICEFLHVSPKEFFDWDVADPNELNKLVERMKLLNQEQTAAISTIVRGLTEK